MVAAPKKLNYTPKEKRVYQAKKVEERVAKKPAAPWEDIMHKVWADPHTGIDQKEIDEPKAKKQFTQCTLMNHGWKYCQKNVRITSISRRLFKLPIGRSNPPRPRKPRLAAVADHSLGESQRQTSQRPIVGTFIEDNDL